VVTHTPYHQILLSPDSWYYITGTYDGTTAKIYLNGKLDNSNSASAPGYYTNFYIGTSYSDYSSSFYNFFDGTIDDVKIYNFALTEDEVKLDYNQGKAMVLGSTGTDASGNASWSSERSYCVPGDATSCSAPVAEWAFDEGTGSTANDRSGNGNTGTWFGTGATHWATGKIGKAGKFNGSDDYVDATTTNFSVNTGTIEMWYKFTDSNSHGGLWNIYTSDSDRMLIWYSNTDDKWHFRRGSDAILDSTNTYTDTNWHHLAVTYNFTSDNYYLYIDGILEDSSSSTYSPPTLTNTQQIGKYDYSTGDQFHTGFIDQVKIYDYARTRAQVAWDYNRGKPIGWWKLDECQGGTANDASGNGYTGTISIGGSGTQTTIGTCASSGAWYNGRNGKYNSSLNFDGNDDRVSVTNASDLYSKIYGNFTYSLWVKYGGTASSTWPVLFGPTGTHNYPGIRGGSGNGANPPYLEWGNYPTCDGSSYSALSAPSETDGNWHHLVYTYDGSTIKVYFDGRYYNQTARSGFCSGASNFYVNYNYNGQVDDGRAYNYALTATQIKQLYNQGAAVQFGPNTGTP